MAEQHHQKSHESEAAVAGEGSFETKDRGLFDFMGKKEEKKPQEEVIATGIEKVHVSEPEHKVEAQKEEGEKKPGLLEKLHLSDSDSSSDSSSDEGDKGEEKKKKKKEKKGLKEKIKEKISGEKEGEKHEHEDTTVPVEKVDTEVPPHEAAQAEEKKGFLDKIKEKLPGQQKKSEEIHPPPQPAETVTIEAASHEGEPKEKKGILEKIKEKLPGYHSKTEEEKEKEKDSASH